MSNLFDNTRIKYGVGYELKLGQSYQDATASSKPNKTSFYQLKYDFLPLSIDKNQDAEVTITENNGVTMKVAQQEGSNEPYTMYQGNRVPSNKECMLIIDTNTGEITLERLQSNINLKRTRLESTNKTQQQLNLTAQRAITPTNEGGVALASNPANKKKTKADTQKKAVPAAANKVIKTETSAATREITPPPPTMQPAKRMESKLFGDNLNLSDSDED